MHACLFAHILPERLSLSYAVFRIPELPSTAVDAPTRQSMLKINKITFYEV